MLENEDYEHQDMLDDVIEALAEQEAAWQEKRRPRKVELDAEDVDAEVCEGDPGKPPFVLVEFNGETTGFGMHAHGGNGGHVHLHHAVAKCLLIGMSRAATSELLKETGYLIREEGESVAAREIDRELSYFYNGDGSFTDKLTKVVGWLVNNRPSTMGREKAERLLEVRYGDPVVLDNAKGDEDTRWKSVKVLKPLVDMAKAHESKFEPKVTDRTPAQILEPIFGPDAKMCFLDGDKGCTAQPLTVKELGELKHKGREIEYYVAKHLKPEPWVSTNGKPWKQETEDLLEHSLKCNLNFERWPDRIAVAEYDQDPDSVLEKGGNKHPKAPLPLQWKIITWVSEQLGQKPVYVCRSAEKSPCSLHPAWDCRGWTDQQMMAFYRLLIAVGFDPVSANHSQKMRLPGGTRRGGGGLQRVIFHRPYGAPAGFPPGLTAQIAEWTDWDIELDEGGEIVLDDRLDFEIQGTSLREASRLGQAMAQSGHYFRSRNNNLLMKWDGSLTMPSSTKFRSSIEDHVRLFQVMGPQDNRREVEIGLPEAMAKALLVNPRLIAQLPLVKIHAPAPAAIEVDGKWKLSKPGYDAELKCYTDASDIEVDETMSLEDAKAHLLHLQKGIPYASEVDRSVHVSHSLCMLMSPGLTVDGPETWPIFFYSANQSRLGKDVAARMALAPFVKTPRLLRPLAVMRSDEWTKRWEDFQRQGDRCVHSENNKTFPAHKIAMIESDITMEQPSIRVLGTSDTTIVDNNIILSMSANTECQIPTADMQRRIRQVRLRLEGDMGQFERDRASEPERLNIKRFLKTVKSKTFSSIWALVRHWSDAGCPMVDPKDGFFSTSPVYSTTIASVLTHAGYENPVAVAKEDVDDQMDTSTEEMMDFLETFYKRSHEMYPGAGSFSAADMSKFVWEYNERNGKLEPPTVKGQLGDADLDVLFGDDAGEILTNNGPLFPSLTADVTREAACCGKIAHLFHAAAGTSFGEFRISIVVRNRRTSRRRYVVERAN